MKKTNRCYNVEQLRDYVNRSIDHAQRRFMYQHLKHCSECDGLRLRIEREREEAAQSATKSGSATV